MKRLLPLLLLLLQGAALAQFKPFRFAFVSDTHVSSADGTAAEDLRRTVRDINGMTGIAFVVITGDITELGMNEELKLAKQILDSLHVPWYIIPGNHDTGWSESGGAMFATVFGADKFSFEYNGIRFLGCPSGPYVRMSDGHIPRSSLRWLDGELRKLNKKPDQPVIFLNHYPIDEGLDNWYEITDKFRHYNTLAILCGHGHANKAMNFEGIPGIMGRSNLRVKDPAGGYNLVDLGADSIVFSERRPGTETARPWATVKIALHVYDTGLVVHRPDYSINNRYAGVKEKWIYSNDANIISTPAISDGLIIVGDQDGKMTARSAATGKRKWTFQSGDAIFSSPAASGGMLVFGSADKKIYCLDSKTGKLRWSYKTAAAVLGSPIIQNDTAFIGGSDHSFMALELHSGKLIWKFDGLNGPVVSTPLLYEGKIIFGAWDGNLYELDKNTGALLWKWNNGSTVRNYSPAACIPVAQNGVVYIVAPDRYISAIDITDGKTLWRNNDATIRESIGISGDGRWVYAKTMNDTIVAYATSREKQSAAWKMNCGFGYEHVPSMLIELGGNVFFGTKNGVVYSIDPVRQQINWAHKIDNSMVNTIKVWDSKHLVVSTMDGKLTVLETP